jgi:hypothetical protein
MNSIKITENLGQEHTSVEEMTKTLMLYILLAGLIRRKACLHDFLKAKFWNPSVS